MTNLLLSKETMSSLQIAEITGKRHSDVLEAIRVMEVAWEKVAQRKFPLGTYKDANQQERPCYELSKTECLYIATKFNDEARAKLILRWEELEVQKINSMPAIPQNFAEALQLAADQAKLLEVKDQQILELEPKATYYDNILSSQDAVAISIIAKDYGISAVALNKVLHDLKVQYKQSDTWLLYQNYACMGYTKTKTTSFERTDGTKGVSVLTKWTQKGRLFLYDILKINNILPLIEQ